MKIVSDLSRFFVICSPKCPAGFLVPSSKIWRWMVPMTDFCLTVTGLYWSYWRSNACVLNTMTRSRASLIGWSQSSAARRPVGVELLPLDSSADSSWTWTFVILFQVVRWRDRDWWRCWQIAAGTFEFLPSRCSTRGAWRMMCQTEPRPLQSKKAAAPIKARSKVALRTRTVNLFGEKCCFSVDDAIWDSEGTWIFKVVEV